MNIVLFCFKRSQSSACW